MIARIIGAMGGVLLTLAGGTAVATNSRPELEQVMHDLLAWLPGEYSTYPQLYLERRAGAMPEGEHGDGYRIFGRIDAPQIAPVVIYGELRSGGPEGALAAGQPVLYVLAVDAAQRAVELSSRRLRDAGRLKAVLARPALWSKLAVEPQGNDDCSFLWRRYGAQLRGTPAESGCGGPPPGGAAQRPRADLEWLLDPEELWVLEAGRRDRTHARFYKARRFDCSAVVADQGRPATRTFSLHDRGGRGWIRQDARRGELAELFRGMVPVGEPPQLRRQTWLTLYGDPESAPIARTVIEGSADRLSLESGDTQLSCALAPASGPR